MVFAPIYIAHYPIFNKIKKYNDFVSVAVCFVLLNILLVVIDFYTLASIGRLWFLDTALPITLGAFVIINLLICIRFIKVNKLLKTGIILGIVSLLTIVLPVIIKVENIYIQKEIDDFNIFQANFGAWTVDSVDNNVFCIISMVLVGLTIAFIASGLISHFGRKKSK